MQIKDAIVKYPAGKVFEAEWGLRQNILLVLNDGTEETIWFKAGQQPHSTLQKGQAVQLLYEERSGKTQRRLIVSEAVDVPEKALQPEQKQSGWTAQEKRAIAAYVEGQADLLGFCLRTSKEKFGAFVETEESIRALATTLYIATQRQFSM